MVVLVTIVLEVVEESAVVLVATVAMVTVVLLVTMVLEVVEERGEWKRMKRKMETESRNRKDEIWKWSSENQ